MTGDPARPHCRGAGCCACLSPLPAGNACRDCAHVYRCATIFGQDADDTACQFVPSRWLIATPERRAASAAALECLAAHEKRPVGDVLADVVRGEPEDNDDDSE